MNQELLLGPVAALAFALAVLWLGVKEPPAWVAGRAYRDLEERRRAEVAERDERIKQVRADAERAIAEYKARAERWEQIAYSFTELGERFAHALEVERGRHG